MAFLIPLFVGPAFLGRPLLLMCGGSFAPFAVRPRRTDPCLCRVRSRALIPVRLLSNRPARPACSDRPFKALYRLQHLQISPPEILALGKQRLAGHFRQSVSKAVSKIQRCGMTPFPIFSPS